MGGKARVEGSTSLNGDVHIEGDASLRGFLTSFDEEHNPKAVRVHPASRLECGDMKVRRAWMDVTENPTSGKLETSCIRGFGGRVVRSSVLPDAGEALLQVVTNASANRSSGPLQVQNAMVQPGTAQVHVVFPGGETAVADGSNDIDR